MLALSLIPIWTVSNPPLQDYPNHLARMYIIAHASDPLLSRYYEIHWTAVPNLAMDAIVPLLARFVPLPVAGKLFVSLAAALIPLGVLLLSRVNFGRFTPAGLTGFLFLYNQAFAKGFINFLFGCGLAFVGIALWIRSSKAHPIAQQAFGIAVSILLFFSHLYALAIYAMFTFVHEVTEEFGHSRLRPAPHFKRLAKWAPQFVLPAAVLFFLSPTGQGSIVSDPAYWTHLETIGWLSTKAYDWKNLLAFSYDRVGGITIMLFGLYAAYMLVRYPRRIPAYALVGTLVATGIFIVMPRRLLSVFDADWRMIVPIALFVAAALPFPIKSRYAAAVATTALVLLFGAHVAGVAAYWHHGDEIYRSLKRVARELPRGESLFPFVSCTEYNKLIPLPLLHITSMAVIERDAFVPSLFADTTQQVLTYAAPYRELQQATGKIYYGEGSINWAYVGQHYDYALNLDEDFGGDPACPVPAGWEVVAASGGLTLLRNVATTAR
jgi:hypothetical protein